MTNIEVAGISAGIGALNMAKQLRRISEQASPKAAFKMDEMKGVMKAAAARGIDPKKALEKMKGKV